MPYNNFEVVDLENNLDITIHDEALVNKIKEKMNPYNTITDLSDFFKIMGDSTRLQLLMILEHGELCVSDLSYLLNMSISAVSHQLKSFSIESISIENVRHKASFTSAWWSKNYCYQNAGLHEVIILQSKLVTLSITLEPSLPQIEEVKLDK